MERDVVLYWSGGKDSALALYELNTGQRYNGYRVQTLLTTFTQDYDRVSGHGIRRELLERQVEHVGLRLHKTFIPANATMDEYQTTIEKAILKHRRDGCKTAAAGDILIEKLRLSAFRRLRLKGCFPLWGKSSYENIKAFIELGFKAYVVCVDTTVLDRSFLGRLIDKEFVDQLPAAVDPSGENGEYHTFVFDGPIFNRPLPCKLGEIVLRETWYFCDVLLAD